MRTPASPYWLLQIFPDGLPNTMSADDKEDLMKFCADYKFDDSPDDPPPQRIYPIEVLDSFCNQPTRDGTAAPPPTPSYSSSPPALEQVPLKELDEKIMEFAKKTTGQGKEAVPEEDGRKA
ncbi:hypothetical protein H0H92_007145 [Tricholoma furcatifolium]|nr:hypothetical protein H0H92_007145 [Tricholoma furcatifolium]